MAEAKTQTLAEFLLARIAEDEHETKQLADRYPGEEDSQGWYGNLDDVTVTVGLGRALAECEAKRRIVRHCTLYPDGRTGVVMDLLVSQILQALALPYADHADYREEWRP